LALAITLSRIAYLLEPFLPETSRKITDQLGGTSVGVVPTAGQRVAQPQPIFPRFEDA
jgi:methionyl-tRNA synthetase